MKISPYLNNHYRNMMIIIKVLLMLNAIFINLIFLLSLLKKTCKNTKINRVSKNNYWKFKLKTTSNKFKIILKLFNNIIMTFLITQININNLFLNFNLLKISSKMIPIFFKILVIKYLDLIIKINFLLNLTLIF